MNKKSSEITETEHKNWVTDLVDEMMEEYSEKQEKEMERNDLDGSKKYWF